MEKKLLQILGYRYLLVIFSRPSSLHSLSPFDSASPADSATGESSGSSTFTTMLSSPLERIYSFVENENLDCHGMFRSPVFIIRTNA